MKCAEVKIIEKSEELPAIAYRNFFHSEDFFRMLEQTPGCTPYMAVAYSKEGTILAHILAVVYRRGSFLPPYLYSCGRIYGEGEYAPGESKNDLFGEMVEALTRRLRRRMCLYIEFSNLSKKMFGYRHLRRHGYFPVRWLQIHNSLHSKPPEARISERTKKRIESAFDAGVETREASTEEEVQAFHKVLRRYYRFKFQRFIPRRELFLLLWKSQYCKILLTLSKGRIIGGSALVYTGKDAYLWYMVSRNKTHLIQHPRSMTIWHALQHSHEHGFEHLRFMNVGLPFSKNPIRESILRFGGKPTSTFRWFRFSFGFVNKIVGWFLND